MDEEEYNMDDVAGDSPSDGSSDSMGASDSDQVETFGHGGGSGAGTSSLSEVSDEDEDSVESTPLAKTNSQSGLYASKEPGQPLPWTDYQDAVAERTRIATAPRFFAKAPVIDPILTVPHSSSVNALFVPACGTHLFSGGADGFIRRIGIQASLLPSNAENLTMRQGGHPTLAEREGEADPRPFLVGYWENEDDLPSLPRPDARMRWGPKSVGNATQVSPVYSLAIHSQELWGLSGTELGNINLFTLRHDEGQIKHVLRCLGPDASTSIGHRYGSAVSALDLSDDETKLLSGAWDGSVAEWDLNTGQAVNDFGGHGAQISSVFYRAKAAPALHDERSSPGEQGADESMKDDQVDDADLGATAPTAGLSTRAEGQKAPKEAADAGEAYDPLFDDADGSGSDAPGSPDDGLASAQAVSSGTTAQANGATGLKPTTTATSLPAATEASLPPLSNDLVLASAIDGQVLLWDRRRKATDPESGFVRRLPLPPGTSPWAASAAWSVDGSKVFVGRRQNAVDVYDLRFVQTGRTHSTIKLPMSSGAVSCVLPWPDGKHLACASFDNVRLWNLRAEEEGVKIPFRIIPGNSSGFVSQMCVTPSQRYLITASGDRGWDAPNNESVVIHEIRHA